MNTLKRQHLMGLHYQNNLFSCCGIFVSTFIKNVYLMSMEKYVKICHKNVNIIFDYSELLGTRNKFICDVMNETPLKS